MERVVTEVTVRQFEEHDFEAVEQIVLQGFKNKFRVLASLGDQKLLKLLQDTGFISTHSFEGYFVATSKEKVLGVMLLKWQGQQRKQSATLNIFNLISTYGLFTMLKYAICIALLEEYIDAYTCYVELLAVDVQARGLGIGTALLAQGLRLLETHPDLRTFSLYVGGDNTTAYHLYERLGIHEKCRKHNILAKLFFKEASWIYMSTLDPLGNKNYYLKRKGWWLGFLGALGLINLPTSWFMFIWLLWFIPERR